MNTKLSKSIKYIYYFIMLVIYPLVMHDMYFDISNTKLVVFYVASFILVLGSGVVLMTSDGALKDYYLEFALGGLFIASLLVCFLINGRGKELLIGELEYNTGLIFLLTLAISCICMVSLGDDSKKARRHSIFTVMMLVTGCVVGVVSIIQFVGYDIGGMLGAIQYENQIIFLGTFGNISFTGFYFVMIFPFAVYGLTAGGNRFIQGLGFVSAFIAATGVLISNNDGTVLAFAVVMLVLGIIMLKSKPLAYYVCLLLTGLAFSFVGLLTIIPSARFLDIHQRLLVRPGFLAIIYVLSIAGIVLARKAAKNLFSEIIWCICAGALGLVCIMPILIIVYTNMHDHNPNTFWSNLLYFDVHWGTDRGYLWEAAWKIFKGGNPIQMLFGQGPESFGNTYIKDFYEISLSMGVYPNYDAHNIFLQFLCEYGIVGTGFGLAFLILRIKKGLAGEDFFCKSKAVALLGCMMASMFLVVQNITLGFLCLLI